ncbi:MAG TPA: response regulator transcription factor [Candidatus Omnitrophota bacterium]|nr:response regulator transcription factor [Candidatus Omnitrophota bacterium]HPS36680.1 response regulator transcription factor [Candidatus Omnitrophota bacterium]
MRILLVEDDSRVAGFVRRGLREEQYAVDRVADGEQALQEAQTNEYDLIILDLMLPRKDGMEVLRELRAGKNNTPVLILTAKDKPKDKVDGLNAGADDYLTKPFGFEELLARVRALLRRRGDMIPTVLSAGDLEVDTVKHKVRRTGRDIDLTNREYALLEFFLRHPNQVVTRTMLSEHVWESSFDSFSNVIDVHIARLRQKLDDGSEPKLLRTLRGKGYILEIPEQE